MELFHFAALLEFLDDSRKESPAVMFQPHAMGDAADARGLRLLGEVGEHFVDGNF